MRPKHVPERSCTGCGARTAKREMVRIVRVGPDSAEIDPTGKRPGRGAYLCPQMACWEVGVRRGRLENTLRMRLSGEARSALMEHARRWMKGAAMEGVSGGQ